MTRRDIMKYFFSLILLLIFFANEGIAQTFTSSNLPIVSINTLGNNILDEPKVQAWMKIIYHRSGDINHLNDTTYDYNGYIGIEIRGSSSKFLYDKKGYGIETRDSLGQNLNVSILDMPEENDWVLYGPYGDKSLLRNVLEYKLSNDMGRYASRTRFCELVLNNEYLGLYVVMEKVKRDKHRIDISKLNPDENSGDDVTGGYIVKLDKYDGSNSGLGWSSPYSSPYTADYTQTPYFQYEYPKNDEITDDQKKYIKDYVTAFEEALKNKPYNDLVNGFQAYADVNSMVDYFILNELSHNVDGYRLSTFIYKDKDNKGGKLHFGPIWDLNLGFGNADYCEGGSSTGWAFQFNFYCDSDQWQVPFWWYTLFYNSNFRKLVADRWSELRQGPFSTDKVLDYIDSTVAVIHDAEVRNFDKWNILGEYVWPNLYIGNTYNDELSYLKNWIIKRFSWMDVNLPFDPTGIDDDPLAGKITFYPNPFSGQLSIDLTDLAGRDLAVHIYDVYGNELWNKSVRVSGLNENITWNAAGTGKNYPPGVYIIGVTSGNEILFSRKVIKTD